MTRLTNDKAKHLGSISNALLYLLLSLTPLESGPSVFLGKNVLNSVRGSVGVYSYSFRT